VTVWRAKPGSILRWSRAAHLGVGFVVPAAAWALARGVAGAPATGDAAALAAARAAAGHAALGWASLVVLVGGIVWELSSPTLERIHRGWGGWWPWADVADLAGFVAGWLIAAILCLGWG